MKRIISFFFAVMLLVTFCGCHANETGGVSFYYSRSPEQYQYFEKDSVICPEKRELMGHRQDLQYLAGLYLAGPMSEDLVSPFPKTVRLLSVQQINNTVQIELTDQSIAMSDSEFSLACTCLAMTCMEFTGCSNVIIVSGERSVTMNTDNILLFDPLPQQETNGG